MILAKLTSEQIDAVTLEVLREDRRLLPLPIVALRVVYRAALMPPMTEEGRETTRDETERVTASLQRLDALRLAKHAKRAGGPDVWTVRSA